MLNNFLNKAYNKLLFWSERITAEILIKYRMWQQPQIITHQGVQIPIGEHLSKKILKAVYGGYYEEAECQMVKTKLDQEDVVMEIGAGIGFISSYCAKQIGSENIFTYEANPALEPHIRNVYAHNNVSPTLEICLLGEQPGEQTFYVEKNFWSSSTIQRSPDAKPVKVPVRSFNQELERIKPTFLIIDIEGGEYDLLKSANLDNIKKIAIELHERIIGKEKVEFIKSKLLQAGFKIYNKSLRGEEMFWQRY